MLRTNNLNILNNAPELSRHIIEELSVTDKLKNKKNAIRKLQNKLKTEWSIVNGLSIPSKMPGVGYSLPSNECITGKKLAKTEGTVCHGCYTFKGNYLYDNVQHALYERFDSLAHPMWVNSMATLINEICSELGEFYFRWHDSGDLQSVEHLEKIIAVCRLTPNVNHWLPTKEYKILNDTLKLFKSEDRTMPANLTIRVSAHLLDTKAPEIYSNTSTVTTTGAPVTNDSVMCEAYKRNNVCGDCRACWSKDVVDVTYKKH